MAYPTPAIYTYRVTEVDMRRTPSEGFFIAEFSPDSGTTWIPVFPWTFQSENEAMGEIANVVSEEAQFQARVQKGDVPVVSVSTYPPA